MGKLSREVLKRQKQRQKAMALAYAEGAVEGAVRASPAPGRSVGRQTKDGVVGKYATGRTRAAIEATNNVPTTYDPGPRAGTYRIPRKRAARFHVRRRRHGDSVVLSAGVPYLGFVVRHGYRMIEAGHAEGLRRVRMVLRGEKP